MTPGIPDIFAAHAVGLVNENRHAVALTKSKEGFAAAMARSGEQKQARQAAEQLVATTFIEPILAHAREDPFRTELFHGGFGEQAFAAQLDTMLADRLVQRSGWSLVDAVYASITRPTNGERIDARG